jgi:shikimate kinase
MSLESASELHPATEPELRPEPAVAAEPAVRPEPVEGPIVLIGAPGSGKSTVGAMLAERLGLTFRDVDAVIVERAGKPITEIFTDDGEPVFRALEEQITAELLPLSGVLSLGGGAVLSASTRVALRGHRVIWLRVGLAQSVKRVGLDTARPLLLGNVRGRLRKLLDERAELYREVATEVIDTDEAAPADIVEMIMNAHGTQR